ncbi:hypothetical protein AAG570_004783 [Ranatra chinensis]|uniref:Protein arginine N-methyltransferase n=1 Tax=Ranatra chinensis TaxID=642074 RepID=A0ABD0Y1U4_9HEMI
MVVARLSDLPEVDSDCPELRKQSEAMLVQEMLFASHLGLSTAIVRLHGMRHVNLARITYSIVGHHSHCPLFQLWFQVPMVNPEVNAASFREGEEQPDLEDPWEWWNKFRLLCNSDKKVGVALELSADLPDEPVISRWLGEPLKSLVLHTSLFLTNRKGYPVLSQAHQSIIKRFAHLNLQVIITGANRHSSIKNYMQYIDHVYQNSVKSEQRVPYSSGYEDHLQIPLQPLMDNLESTTYEVFEKDPVKYSEYLNAIYQALIDKVPEEEAETNVQVIMVVGAGRGPLVTASLKAAESANRKVRIYAVEKNPNAIVTLLSLKEEVWKDSVTVVSCDMRDWPAPEQCDILVSELLGSFGDNELSPECLDGPEKFLKPDGISIPCSYTSYIRPLQSSRLHNGVGEGTLDKPFHKKFQTPYVVHQLNTYNITPPKPLFTFHHPNRETPVDHTRYGHLNFHITQNSVCHGFAGYFDAVLYKDVKLSILPDTYSKGMFSWFPIYFPIKEPIRLKKGDEMEVHFWRLANKKKVWYEWCVSSPVQVPVHNLNGKSSSIGLY